MVFLPQSLLSKTYCSQCTQPPELEDGDREWLEAPIIQWEAVHDLPHVLNAHKSTGLDRIHQRVLKKQEDVLTKPLSIIYQHFWLTRKVPDDLRLANVTVIHNKDRKENPGNYRPVSLTSVPGRLCHPECHHTFCDQIQPAGPAAWLTWSPSDKTTCLLHEGKAVDAVYMDFSEACDTCPQYPPGKSSCLWLGQVYGQMTEELSGCQAQSHSEWSSIHLTAGHQLCSPGLSTGASFV